jgi:sec-independent protein translocase protein TatC
LSILYYILYTKKIVRYLFQIYIEEGKLRTLYLSIGLSFALSTCCMYSTELLFLCVKPLLCLDKSFIFTELTEAFYVTLKVCCLWSFGCVLPLLLYHTWCFVAPSCFPLERVRLGVLCLMCGCLSALAMVGTYTIVLPKVASILLSFEITDPIVSVQLEARVGPYINLSLQTVLLAVTVLQLPLVFGVCFHLGIFHPSLFTNNRKLLLFVSLLLAALVSPPDVSAQCGLALVLSLCWETVALSGFIIGVLQSKR